MKLSLSTKLKKYFKNSPWPVKLLHKLSNKYKIYCVVKITINHISDYTIRKQLFVFSKYVIDGHTAGNLINIISILDFASIISKKLKFNMEILDCKRELIRG